jgi:malonate transporter
MALFAGVRRRDILAGEYKVEEPLVAATVSITTLLSVVTLLGWLYALSRLSAPAG